MKATTSFKMPSVTEIVDGKCPQTIYENMKIILSRTNIPEAFGELFILVDKQGFIIVRLMDLEYIDGDILLTVTNQENSKSYLFSHSIHDVPKFVLIKLSDVLTLANNV